jgi:glycerol-3-phosphate O-acyltransferase
MGLIIDMFGLVRSFFVKLLSVYFRLVPVPASLHACSNELNSMCIITESESLILEALLLSFAKRLNKKIYHFIKFDGSKSECIKWTSLHNDAALEKILTTGSGLDLATLNIFSGRGPFKANPAYRLGFWELMGILFLGRFLIIFLGHPIPAESIKSYTVSKLRRILRIDFYKNLKQVRGTPFQSIQAQEKIILGGNEYQTEISHLADKLSIPRNELLRKARRSFYEIAANPRRPMYRILAFIVNFINKRLFQSIHSLGLENLKTAVREKTVVLVPMHRSHLDYMLIGSELYRAHFIPPLVAAGINLSFWPAGFLIRSVGAYFVKRNVGSDRLHALMLKRYVSYLVKRGHMQEFFIEGGRSRSGRMRQPKVGLLSIFIDAYTKGFKDDIAFVPVSITYENVIEDSVYGQENTGRAKTKESLLGLFKAGSIFKRRYGDVVINFGPAISLKDCLTVEKTIKSNEGAKISVTNFALHITRKIREQTNPSLTSLIHTALLVSPAYGLSKQELIENIKNLGMLLDIDRRWNPGIGESTPSLKYFLEGQESLLNDISLGNTIKSNFCLGKEIYYIPGERRFTADFYKNSTLHLFFEHSIFSLLDLMDMDINHENLEKFHTVYSSDFLLKDKKSFLKDCDNLIALLIKEEILKKEKLDVSYARRDAGIYLPSLLLPSIENLTWSIKVLSSAAKAPDNLDTDEEDGKISLDFDSIMHTMINEFRAAGYLGITHCTEASSSSALNAALETLQNLGAIFITNRQGKSKRIIIKDLKTPKLDIIHKAGAAIQVWKSKSAVRQESGILIAFPSVKKPDAL